jgi:hypothetical protein
MVVRWHAIGLIVAGCFIDASAIAGLGLSSLQLVAASPTTPWCPSANAQRSGRQRRRPLLTGPLLGSLLTTGPLAPLPTLASANSTTSARSSSKPDLSLLQAFSKVALPFFKSNGSAWLNLIGLLILGSLVVGINVGFSIVTKDFHNAMAVMDMEIFVEKLTYVPLDGAIIQCCWRVSM